jgi:nucleoside-diphosphate-sugar epimerase
VTLVFHLAGAVKALNRAGYERINHTGTRNLLAAVAARAPRALFVHVSSLAAAGPSIDGGCSARPPEQTRPVSNYGESKRLAELAVCSSGLAWTIVRPPVVYGPGDAATRLLFRQACALRCPVPREPRPLSVIHVEDAVSALLLAAAGSAVSAIVPLDGRDRTDTHAFLRAIADACGHRARFVFVPKVLATVAAGVADCWAAVSRRPGFFSRDKVAEIHASGWVADGRVARERLAFEPAIGLQAGLREVALREGFRT